MEEKGDTHTEKRQEYARLETRAFSIVLETIGIFGIPALIAVGFAKWLSLSDSKAYILLALMFILSWVILIRRVKQMTKKLEDMRKKMKQD